MTAGKVVLLDVDGTAIVHPSFGAPAPWLESPHLVEISVRSPLGQVGSVGYNPAAMQGLRALVDDGLLPQLWWSSSWVTSAWRAGLAGWRSSGHPAGDPQALDDLGVQLGLGGVIGYPPADAFIEPPDRHGIPDDWSASRHWKVLLATRLADTGHDVVVLDDDLGAAARRYLGRGGPKRRIGWIRPGRTGLTISDVRAVRRWIDGSTPPRLDRTPR